MLLTFSLSLKTIETIVIISKTWCVQCLVKKVHFFVSHSTIPMSHTLDSVALLQHARMLQKNCVIDIKAGKIHDFLEARSKHVVLNVGSMAAHQEVILKKFQPTQHL